MGADFPCEGDIEIEGYLEHGRRVRLWLVVIGAAIALVVGLMML